MAKLLLQKLLSIFSIRNAVRHGVSLTEKNFTPPPPPSPPEEALSKITLNIGLISIFMDFFALLIAFILTIYAGLGVLVGTLVLAGVGLWVGGKAKKAGEKNAKTATLVVDVALIFMMLLFAAATIAMR
jgi:hypothetical protein